MTAGSLVSKPFKRASMVIGIACVAPFSACRMHILSNLAAPKLISGFHPLNSRIIGGIRRVILRSTSTRQPREGRLSEIIKTYILINSFNIKLNIRN